MADHWDASFLDEDDDDDNVVISELAFHSQTKKSQTATKKHDAEIDDPDWINDFVPQHHAILPHRIAKDTNQILPDADDDSDHRNGIRISSSDDDLLKPILGKTKSEPSALEHNIDAKITKYEKSGARDDDLEMDVDGVTQSVAVTQPQQIPGIVPLYTLKTMDKDLALLCCEHADDNAALELSGDVGTIGRVKIDHSKSEVLLDIKGVMYQVRNMLTNTMGILTLGDNEAKITGLIDQVFVLHAENPDANREQVVSGHLDFDLGDDDMEMGDAVVKAVSNKTDADAKGDKSAKKAKKAKASDRDGANHATELKKALPKIKDNKTPGKAAKPKPKAKSKSKSKPKKVIKKSSSE